MMGRRTSALVSPVWMALGFAPLLGALLAGCARPPRPAASGWPVPALAAKLPTPPPGHSVAAGETACTVAGRYGIAPDALLRANGLSASPGAPLAAGTQLQLPDDAPLRHRVRAGESLSTISAQYGVTVAALARANGLADPDLLFVGADLRIPPGAANGCSPAVVASRDREASDATDSRPPVGAVEGDGRRAREATALAERLRPADALLAEGRERYGAADFVGAIELAAAAAHALDGLDAAPPVTRRRAQSAWLAAVSWAGLGRREEALERFEQVLELDPAVAEQEAVSPRLQALIEEARARSRRP